MNTNELKSSVHDYWNKQSCGTGVTAKDKFSRAYYEEIEQHRYTLEPIIFSFAQFTRYRDKKMLEVGVGAGTDFLQWVRAGTLAHGIDLTKEAIDNTSNRLACYGLKAHELGIGDAEQLPYENNFFDLVYSWGVIHHSPNTEKCLAEIIRVAKSGGQIKIMIYNKYAVFTIFSYIRSLLRGKFYKSLDSFLYHQQESLGTKAYSLKTIKKMLEKHPVKINYIHAPMSKNDFLSYSSKFKRSLAYFAAFVMGWHRAGWFLMIELEKK